MHTQYEDDEDADSDFSVDEQSTLLETMQKLRKLDPETLILNFSQLQSTVKGEVDSDFEACGASKMKDDD